MGFFGFKKKKAVPKYKDLTDSQKIKYIVQKSRRVLDLKVINLLYEFNNMVLFFKYTNEEYYKNIDGRHDPCKWLAHIQWVFINFYFRELKKRGFPNFQLTANNIFQLLESIKPLFYFKSPYGKGWESLIDEDNSRLVFEFLNYTLNLNKTAVHELFLKALRARDGYYLWLLQYTKFQFDPKVLKSLLKRRPFNETEQLYVEDFWMELADDMNLGSKTKEKLSAILLNPANGESDSTVNMDKVRQLEEQVKLLSKELATLREERISNSASCFFTSSDATVEVIGIEEGNKSLTQ